MYKGVLQLSIQDYRLTELALPTQTIMKIDIQICPSYIYLLSAGKIEGRIDLSQLVNLTDLRLMGVKKDIMFPGRLNSLEISQATPNQFKIMNDELTCKRITATGFDLSQLNLVMEGITKDTMLPDKLNSLVISQATPNQFKILNNRLACKDASVTNFNVSKVTFNDCENLTLVNIQGDTMLPGKLNSLIISQATPNQFKIMNNTLECKSITATGFDAPQLNLVMEGITKDTMLPGSLNSLVISQATPNQYKIMNDRLACKSITATGFDAPQLNLVMEGITKDTMLPGKLRSLVISQATPNQFKIMNDRLSCKSITATGFDLSQLNLVMEGITKGTMLPDKLNSLVISQATPNQFKILNDELTCKSITATGFDLSQLNLVMEGITKDTMLPGTLNSLEISQATPNQFKILNDRLTCKSITATGFDLSQLNLVMEGITKDTMLPGSLNSLVISQATPNQFKIMNDRLACKSITATGFDLSQLNLVMEGITKDTMLPDKLNSLVISQTTPNQFKILNDELTCKDASVTNFDVSKVTFNDCENLTLYYDAVPGQIIDLSKHTNLKDLALKNVNNDTMLPGMVNSLVISQATPNQFKIMNNTLECKSITATGFDAPQLNLVMEGITKDTMLPGSLNSLVISQATPNQFKILNDELTCKSITATGFDLSQLNLVMEGITKDTMLPDKLNSLVISQATPNRFKILNDRLSCKDASVTNFDVSKVTFNDCENLSLVSVIGNDSEVDLSYLVHCKNITLRSTRQDIILPDQFDKLELIQNLPENRQYQIINRSIQCDEISITNYYLTNIELRNCSKITLTGCIADRLSLANLTVDKLQIKFTACEFKVLDYSESNYLKVDDSLFVGNIGETVILPNMLEKISWSKYYIDELVFPTLDSIISINLKLCPRIIYSTFKGTKNNIIDLSDLDKLEEVILHGINNNILLPDKLSKLELDQPEQFKFQIQNQSISCNDTKISNFNLMNIELKDSSTISLTNCTADSLSLTNLVVDKLQIQFTKCEFNTLDYSESNLSTVDDSWFVDNKVEKVILPNIVEKINWSKYYIDELVFATLDSIISINLKLCPRIIYSTFKGTKNNIIDLSDLDKLEEVILHGINNNILLPDKLSKLELDQPEQFKFQIQNQSISCDDTKISNFNLMNIELKDSSTISLTNCTADSLSLTNLVVDKLQIQFTKCEFNTLDYSESNLSTVDDSWFVDNKVEKVILPNTVEKIYWKSYYINELIFPTLESIKSISIQLCPRVIYSTFNLIGNNVIDLSRFTNLKDVTLHKIQNDILLPNQLNKLELVQAEKFKYKIENSLISCNDITIEKFQFSQIKLTDCKYLELWNCQINQLFLENENMNIKIRNSHIGLCKFQESIDIDSFSKKYQNCCEFVSHSIARTGITHRTKTQEQVKTLNKSIILAIKMDAIFRKTNELLNE